MSLLSFIEKVNQLASRKEAFFFLIDFEKKKPMVFSPQEANEKGIYFAVNGHTNYAAVTQPNLASKVKVQPVNFERYKTAFDKVQCHLSQGDSYLVNLTFPSKIKLYLQYCYA